jgi:DNA-binding NarL/FixJ family response regulator
MPRSLTPDNTTSPRPGRAPRSPRGGPGVLRLEPAPAGPPRVVVADPHPASRFGIRLALERAGVACVAEAAEGGEAAAHAAALHPDLCLIDADVPGGGIATVRAIARGAPGTVVLMLAAALDHDELVAALVAGASGYVAKTIAPDRLAVVVRAVLAGEVAIPRASGRRLVEEIRRRANGTAPSRPGRSAPLTPRETQVTDLLQAGLATREIAARLGISEVTVRRHVSTALRKLDVPDRRAAVRLFQRSRNGRTVHG